MISAGLRRKLAVLVSGALLTACQTARVPEPVVRTVEVRIPVATACVPNGTPTTPPPRATLGIGETGSLIQTITGELIARRAYDDQVAPVIAACRRPAG